MQRVVGPEVALDDPSARRGQLTLELDPLLPWHWDKTGLPELLVELDHGETSNRAKPASKRRLARRSSTQNDDALHLNDAASYGTAPAAEVQRSREPSS